MGRSSWIRKSIHEALKSVEGVFNEKPGPDWLFVKSSLLSYIVIYNSYQRLRHSHNCPSTHLYALSPERDILALRQSGDAIALLMNYAQAIEYILTYSDMERGTAPIDKLLMSLDSMKSLLARLGNPQDERHTVHIAGSKGKGSTSTMVASILKHAGKRTAFYQSPHMHSYTERVQIDSSPVSQQEFADALLAIKDAVEAENSSGNGPIVTFGILTAIFFEIARRQGADWQVLEVGLGGTTDATNVCRVKEIAVITPISIEHTLLLGATPAEIAVHKAGIIIEGSTAILAPQQDPTVKPIVERRCREVGAQLIDVDQIYKRSLVEASRNRQVCNITGAGRNFSVNMRLLGRHQLDNAATAIAVADTISKNQFIMSDDSIVEGIANAFLPGRLEELRKDPTLIVDGAHNAESARVLRIALKEHFHYRRCIIVLGVNNDKKIDTILRELATVADVVIATRSQNARSMDPTDIAQNKEVGTAQTIVTASLPEAIDQALALAGNDDLVCVTGSLYLVSEARSYVLGEIAQPA